MAGIELGRYGPCGPCGPCVAPPKGRKTDRRSLRREPVKDHDPSKVPAGDGKDRLMTRAEFARWKREILPLLRSPGDPPPRLVMHGKQKGRFRFCAHVRELLEANRARGSVLMRGYKLSHVPLTAPNWGGQEAWKATFHMLVAHPPAAESSKWIYECANRPPDEEDCGKEYIFVPSSRAHAELSDEQLLSSQWALGFVIGGNKPFVDMVIADQTKRGRRKSVIGRTPEEVIAKRMTKTYLMPCFQEWYDDRKPAESIDSIAEMMGFPSTDVAESLDMCDIEVLRKACIENPDALVDGTSTLTMRIQYACALAEGRVTYEELADAFFDHYDAQKRKIDKIISSAMDFELIQLGYQTNALTQGMV